MKKINWVVILNALFVLISVPAARGGDGVREALYKGSPRSSERILSGNLDIDLLASREELRSALGKGSLPKLEYLDDAEKTKCPVLAGLLSAVVPGTGEFYSESHLKGGAFLAAEVIAWAINIAYNRKGDRSTEEFQSFADANWSAVDYATWLNENARRIKPNANCTITISSNTSLPHWQRVNWRELNDCERELGGIFSHVLPSHGDQQYFELIGKYPQYNPGWRDADRSHVSEDNISALFKNYAGMRGDANALYNVASTAVIVVVVNHILSAADAAWSASRYNKVRTQVGMRMQRTPLGFELMPTASLEVRW